MKKMQVCTALVGLTIAFSATTFPQDYAVATAAPFLRINPSAEANGQGYSSVSRITDDPFATFLNPAQLGFSNNRINAVIAFYPTKIPWLPSAGLGDLTLNSRIVSGGINLEKFVALPISIGFAQSRFDLNLGNQAIYGLNRDTLGMYNPNEFAEANSVGIGADLGVRFAFGVTVRKITSTFATFNGFGMPEVVSTKAWSYDYGMLLQIPVLKLVRRESEIISGVAPTIDFAIGTVLSNVGGKVAYIDQAQADPLPRTISLGTTLSFGLVSSKIGLRFFAFSWSRQSDNELVGIGSTDSYYRGGFGDINFTQNIILGKRTTNIDLSQGWELGVMESAYARGGSFNGTGERSFTTSGFGLRTTGLFKIFKEKINDNTVWSFIFSHFDFRYDWSELVTLEQNEALVYTKLSSLALKVSF